MSRYFRRSAQCASLLALCGAMLLQSASAGTIALKGPAPDDPEGPILDLGWTAEVPNGVELLDIKIDGTTILFTKKATFHNFNPISIVFTQDPQVAAGKNETFFNVTEDITNMTGVAWDAFRMSIADDNDNTSNTGAVHPRRAHFHPAAWDGNDAETDYIATGFPGGNLGTYVMNLNLKDGHDPTSGDGGKLTGGLVRLHDRLETDATRMKFTLTEWPIAVPEPSTFALAAVGLLTLGLLARRRR